jgi:hypothetical protein|tara:strand:+ start:1111 stop:1233 length:123 start_codon:yes stop_codon:yes gene_type:complete
MAKPVKQKASTGIKFLKPVGKLSLAQQLYIIRQQQKQEPA